ncbi:hypothetical protein [Clostridium sp.]|uniref:hypothetical protein n=1 Tax=Clostridium sp. TaxID=1506 RepID=UPI003D6D79EC
MYLKYPEFLNFLEHFDNYIVKEAIPLENLVSYEKIIIDTKSAIFDAMDQGKKDGSIKSNIDNDAFYITITHSLMSLCQKLILRGTILKSYKDIGGETAYSLGQFGWSLLSGIVGSYLNFYYIPTKESGIITVILQVAFFGFLTIIGLITMLGRFFDN